MYAYFTLNYRSKINNKYTKINKLKKNTKTISLANYLKFDDKDQDIDIDI